VIDVHRISSRPHTGTEDIMRQTQSSEVPPVVEPELGIWFDGRAYHYQQYRYDQLQDAIAYARIDRSRPGFHDEPLPRHWEEWHGPTSAEAARMATFGIVYDHGFYRYGPFRYDVLDDALDYARRTSPPTAASDPEVPRNTGT
jgi:hypothetical protein